VLPTGRRRNKDFAENPLGFGRFQGKIKTERFCKIWYLEWCAKILKFGRDFLEK
jgi:hypothetical protein